MGPAVVTDPGGGRWERAGALVLDLAANGELRIALISRRGPLSPPAMSFLDGADGTAVKPPYRATL